MPIRYRDNALISIADGFKLAKEYGLSNGLETSADNICHDGQPPLFWTFPITNNPPGKAGGVIYVDKLDGHVNTSQADPKGTNTGGDQIVESGITSTGGDQLAGTEGRNHTGNDEGVPDVGGNMYMILAYRYNQYLKVTGKNILNQSIQMALRSAIAYKDYDNGSYR